MMPGGAEEPTEQTTVHWAMPKDPRYPGDRSSYCGLQPPYAEATGTPGEVVCSGCAREKTDDAWRARTDNALRGTGLFPPKTDA